MKCAPFNADSENSTPLLATIPTGVPKDGRTPSPAWCRIRFELVEEARVYESRDDFANVVRRARIARHNPVEIVRSTVGSSFAWTFQGSALFGASVDTIERTIERAWRHPQRGDDDTGRARVDQSPAQVLVGHYLSGRGPHERWSAQENGSLARTMTDSSDIAGTYAPPAVHEPSTAATWRCPLSSCAPGCRRCDRSGRGREDLVLSRKKRATGIDEVEACRWFRQRHFLGAQVLFTVIG